MDRLSVTAEAKSFTLERKAGSWFVKEKGGYPATFARVKEALVSLSQLKQFERKTSDPSRYDKLDLEDPDKKGASSKRLTAFVGDRTVADVIVGKSNAKEILFGRSLVYVRLPGDKQSWLAAGDPKLAAEIGDWLDRSVLDVKTGRIREVVQTAAGGTGEDAAEPARVIVGKDKAGDAEFTLRNMPEGREIKGERFPALHRRKPRQADAGGCQAGGRDRFCRQGRGRRGLPDLRRPGRHREGSPGPASRTRTTNTG